MPPGKLAAQAGHAFVEALNRAKWDAHGHWTQYLADPPGTKVVLFARDEYELLRAHEEVEALVIPNALIVDQGHVLLPFFDGSPVTTALGIGPARRAEVAHITNRFALVP